MSRFAIDPRWLLYLPPTMSPVATSPRGDLLEHPDQAFTAYRADGVESVLCEEKHMGSRAVLLVCRSPATHAPGSAPGRWPGPARSGPATGRPFFPPELGTASLLDPAPRRRRPSRAVRRARHLVAAPGRRTAALEPQGRPTAPRPVRRRRRRRPGLAAPRGRGRWSRPPRGLPDASGLGALLARTRSRAANADAFTQPTCATAGRSTTWQASASPRSSSSPPRAPSTTTAPTCGT